MSTSKTLREAMSSGRTLWKATVWDGLSSRLGAQAGFDLLLASGYNISASMALPDVGLTSMTEVLNACNNCARAAGDTPVIADIDTGYGNAVNVMRTMREFENIGVAGVQLEDQMSPKRCPYLGKTSLVSLEEAVGKVRAAVAARRNPDFVISARTDAETVDEAIVRGRAYVEAGADMLFVVSKGAVKTIDDARRLKAAVKVPIAFSVYDWHYETTTPSEFAALGGIIIGSPFAAITIVAEAMKGYYNSMMEHHDLRSLKQPKMPLKEFETLIGMQEVDRIQRTYMPEV